MGNHIHKAWRKERQIREPPDLPVEIIVNIFSRADPVTLVRCAATSKILRRHITDPAFLRLRQNADGGFDPSLLVGMFFCHVDDEARRFAPVPPSAKLTLSLAPAANGGFGPNTYTLVVSRAGLVVLRRHRTRPDGATVVDLCVGSPVTGRYTFLPAATLSGYSHVLIPGDEDEGAGRSFRLLVLGAEARTQTFSSKAGAWGPVTEPPAHLDPFGLARCSAVVLHGVAHWLCQDDDHGPSSQRYAVLAIRVGDGQATAIEVPRRCLRRRRREVTEELLLVRSADERLGLLVAETLGVSIWTLSEDSKSWARRVVVERARMLQSVKLYYHPFGCVDAELEWFGDASGTVVLQMNGAGILLLNLRTLEISQFREGREIRRPLRCCPYEMDLASLLAAMKTF